MSARAKLRLGDAEANRIGLGTNRLGNTPENVAFVKAAVVAGLTLIDTAHTYAGGESEETIGAALSPVPDGCVVATKGGWSTGRPDVLGAEIEESLRRLRTDSIALYYLHRVDPETPLEESLAVIGEYRESGKIRNVGVSNVGVDQIERARRVVSIAAVQNHYNLSERKHDDVVDYCAREGIVFGSLATLVIVYVLTRLVLVLLLRGSGDQIGAPPGSTVMHQNVTVAEAVVLSAFLFEGERRRIVYEEGNFPSVRYLYQAQTPRGADIVVCPDDAAVVDAIDERTLLVPVTHVLFKTAEIQDVEEIVRRAHEAGAYVVLDAYQSVGTVPLDVTSLGVDFAVGGSVKWLCGGAGAGWLYVRPDLAEQLEPTLVGWQAHDRPFAFEPELRYAQGTARFLTGTPNVPALYAATAGYEVVEEVGIETIRAHSLRQTDLLAGLLERSGFDVLSPRDPGRRGGTLVVHTPHFEAVHSELGERGIICDTRPDVGLRLGPHFFTTDEELVYATDQIADIVESGAYERHLGAAARF